MALVVLSAWAVAVVCLNGFFLDGLLESMGWWGRAALSFVVVAVLVLVLYAVSYKRTTMVMGVALYLVLVVLLIAGAMALSGAEDTVYADAEGNYLYLVLVLVLCATACFLLTRTLPGSAVWFVVAAFACSVVQAFYQSEEVVCSVLGTFTALVLVVHKNLRLGVERADQASAPSSVGTLLSAVAPVAGVFAVALALWFGVIAPLGPGVLDIKLITDYRSLPIVEQKGTAQELPVFDVTLTSDNLVDGFYYTTDDLVEDPTSSVMIDAAAVLQKQQQQQMQGDQGDSGADSGGGESDALDQESLDPQYDPHSYTWDSPWWLVPLIVTILVVGGLLAYFIGRRIWRRRRLERMLAAPPAEQLKLLYRFELERLRRLGFSVPVGMTLMEFAATSQRNMDMITEETRVSFDALTQLYTKCDYGQHEPTEEEILPFVTYYLGFWKAARTQLGGVRYFFRSFRL